MSQYCWTRLKLSANAEFLKRTDHFEILHIKQIEILLKRILQSCINMQYPQ